MNDTPICVYRTFTFPETDRTIASLRTIIVRAEALGTEIQEQFGRSFKELGFTGWDKLRLKLLGPLKELAINIPFHDHLDFHGGEREIYVCRQKNDKPLTAEQERLLRERMERAEGMTSSMRLELSGSTLSVTVQLRNPFPDFATRWDKILNSTPTPEELLKPTGRGLFYVAILFKDAGYDARARTLTFATELELEQCEEPECVSA